MLKTLQKAIFMQRKDFLLTRCNLWSNQSYCMYVLFVTSEICLDLKSHGSFEEKI